MARGRTPSRVFLFFATVFVSFVARIRGKTTPMRSLHRAWRNISPQRLFLVDGLGALLSAISLGVVLPGFERTVGLPAQALHRLAFLAGGLAAYSFLCCWAQPANWRPLLKGIALANLLYGGLTAALLLFRYPTVTAVGGVYFGLELTVVVLLAGWELQTAARPPGSKDGQALP